MTTTAKLVSIPLSFLVITAFLQTSDGRYLSSLSKTNKPIDNPRYNSLRECIKAANLTTSATLDPQVRCAVRKIVPTYADMHETTCGNCTFYFHCTANHRAVFECERSDLARRTAIVATQCAPLSRIKDKQDPILQAALDGRNGRDCARLYLCNSKCNFDPQTRQCNPTRCTSPT